MKNSVKILFAAMLVIFAASCQKEENRDKPGTGEPRTITATLANNDPQTRTHLDENLKTLWSEGDTIWISNGSNSAKIQLIKGEGEPEEGYIKGTLASDESSFTFTVPDGWSTVYAVYPAFAQAGISGGNINIKIPTFQSGKFGDANISVAKEAENVLQFRNATAVVKFVQTSKANDTVYLSANTQLAGKMKIAYSNPFTVTACEPEMTGIIAPFVDDTVSYISVAAGTASNIVVNVKKSENALYSRKTVSSKQFVVNKVYRTSVVGLTSYKDTTCSGANCFIIPCGGAFKFDATYKGNSMTETVGAIDDVEVLWESFGTLTELKVGDIVSIVKREGNIVTVRTTGNEGDAVIAAKDAGGNILWSWHLWVCSGYDPDSTAQVYNNDAGVMMDRNLGAASAIPRNDKSLGLMYQWGRKDPFMGAGTFESRCVASSIPDNWAVVDVGSTGETGNNLSYSISHPMTFISSSASDPDWLTTGKSKKNLWKNSDGSKTIYDPCPSGWRVPDGGTDGIWGKAGFPSSHDFDLGMDFRECITPSVTCWYPAGGYISLDLAPLGAGSDGYYWSRTIKITVSYCLIISNDRSVTSSASSPRAKGHSVRCVKE